MAGAGARVAAGMDELLANSSDWVVRVQFAYS